MLFGEGASVLLKSLAVQPERLIKENFVFTYPEINEALEDIFN
jgi:NAD dependent epimerase/dehydratase family enzyme